MYGTMFRKSTHIWTNAILQAPLRRCSRLTICDNKRNTGRHPVTAQSDDTKHAKGRGSDIAVYPVPAGLIQALTAGFRECKHIQPLPAFMITAITEDLQDWRDTDLDCHELFFRTECVRDFQ